MDVKPFQRWSLKSRVTLSILLMLVIGIWLLAFYASRMLREDMQNVLGEQLFSAASILAAGTNADLKDRLGALEIVAASISPAMLVDPPAVQRLLEQRPVLRQIFNGGVVAMGPDGMAIADFPRVSGRVGTNFMDRDYVVGALKAGKPRIGRPVIGKALRKQVFGMAVPIRDAQDKVIGVLLGVTDLSQPNFLDRITESGFGRTGGYLLVAAEYRLIVTASDKSRVMEILPAAGVNPAVDRFIQGYEGSAVFVNPRGVEVLASAKQIPVAGWYAVALLPTAEAFAPIRAMQERILLAAILLTVVVGGLLWWLLRRQLSPMLDAAQALARLSDDSRAIHPLPIVRQDEVGELIGRFNHLLTTLAQREAALQESEFRWKFAIEGARDGLWDWNAVDNTVFFSKRWKEMLGFAEDEIGNGLHEWESRIHPDDKPATLAVVQDYLDGKTPFYLSEHRVRCKDGSYKWILDRGIVVSRSNDGKPLRLIGTHTDITAHKAAEAALRESGQFSKEIIDCAQEGIIVYGTDLRYQVWNPYMERFTGMQAADVLGHHPLDIFPFLQEGGVMTRLERALAGEIPDATEFPFAVARTGCSGWASDLTAPLRNTRGEVIGVIGTVRDVTDLKRSELALREMNDNLEARVEERTRELALAMQQAEAANRAKSAFLANMSHEIRTPMTAIMGMGDLMKLEPMTPKQTERLDKMNRAAEHLLGIIDDVLDLAKIEAGKIVLEETEVDVGDIAADVVAMTTYRANAKGLRLVVETGVVPGRLIGDSTRIRQALLNYVTNAIKFSERGCVSLRIRLQEDRGDRLLLRFEVEDTGIGVSPEIISRLFRHFEQADNSMTRQYGGTGLGLAIVKQLADLMGGEVGVESEIGCGSTFWFTACLKKARGVGASTMPTPSNAMDGARWRADCERRILVVDDEAMNREVIAVMLETLGVQVEAAAHGGEAVACAEKVAYDLILMDLHMPQMDGIEATRRIRRLPLNVGVPILALTGDAVTEVRDRCSSAGMNDFITKPFKMDQLLDVAAKWLRQPVRSAEE